MTAVLCIALLMSIVALADVATCSGRRWTVIAWALVILGLATLGVVSSQGWAYRIREGRP